MNMVEVWAIVSVAADGSWIIHETHHKDMGTKENRHWQTVWCEKHGERISLIRAMVPKPEPIVEIEGEAI